MSLDLVVVCRVSAAALFLASFALLAYRLRQAWAYAGSRWLLIALCIPVPLLAIGFGLAIDAHLGATLVTYLWPFSGAFLFLVCAWWPDKRRQLALAAKLRRADELIAEYDVEA